MKLEKAKAFIENQKQKETEFLNAFINEQETLSPLGEVAFLVYQFGNVKNLEDMQHFGAEVVRRTQEKSLYFIEAPEKFYKFITRIGIFKAKRMSDNYPNTINRMYFENISSKPHTTLINAMEKNKNLEQYELVTGTADMLHYLNTEKSTGVWTSWLETPNFVLNPYFNLIMPRDDYYHLFDVHALNRIKGADVKKDLENKKLREIMLSKDNEEYLLARTDLIKKFESGQLGE